MKKRFFFIFFFIGRTCVFLQRIFSSDRELPAACAAALLTWHTKVPGYRQGSRNARTRVFARISCPAMKKTAVCQVFISPGRPGKTHFRAAMRRSSDLGEPLRTVAAPRGAVPGCSTWVQGYLGAGVPGCRGTCRTRVQHLGAVPGCTTSVQHVGAVPGCSTWVQHLGAGVPGWSTWVQYLGAVPGCCTWVQYLGAAQHLGAVPGVAHPVRGGWPPHPVRGAAPRQGFHLWWPTCVTPLQSSSGRRTP